MRGESVINNQILTQIGDNLHVRLSGSGDRKGMEYETRISYLCTQAARNRLTLDEECELLSYSALEPEIFLLIEIKRWMREKRE